MQTASLFLVEILHGAGQLKISLKKARVCIAWVFQGHREYFSGPLYRVAFSEFCQTSRSDSLDEEESRATTEAAPGHCFTSP